MAVILTLLATIIAVGSTCATVALWKHSSPRGWFLAGTAGALVAFIPGGLLHWILVGVPIAASMALPKRADVHELTHTAKHRRNTLVRRLGLILAATLLPYSYASALLVTAQRTATAQPTIVDKQEVMTQGQNPYGPGHLVTIISYTFTVDGRIYSSAARHSWGSDDIASAKVCYDPADIEGSHALELADYHCGSFGVQPNG